jgi:hypothetical protein
MHNQRRFPKVVLAALLAVGILVPAMASPAHAVSACVTRTVFATYTKPATKPQWVPKTVCNSGEIAVSAGGFCYSAGSMVGASTTSGTTDRQVWLWCTSTGSAYWYAMCCLP